MSTEPLLFSCPGCGTQAPIVNDQRWDCPSCGWVVMVGSGAPVPDAAIVISEIGHAGSLDMETARRSARAFAAAVEKIAPHVPVEIAIGGFQDDPRDLWEIPEVARYIVLWSAILEADTNGRRSRLLPDSQNLIRLCLYAATGRDHLIVSGRPSTPEDLKTQIEAHRARHDHPAERF